MKIHTAGPGSDNIVSHAKVSVRNRIHSVIIEERAANEQTPYHLSPSPHPTPTPHELKLLSPFMEAGILGFWIRI